MPAIIESRFPIVWPMLDKPACTCPPKAAACDVCATMRKLLSISSAALLAFVGTFAFSAIRKISQTVMAETARLR